ncbi:Amylo-alpha-1,6-glucosidase [Caballeronia sordidicola]|uniref:Amylo-alpha-1,6-glucosidase n=1 Tax=Caballeronia sordidicola TaxID=196367 RepID=A0A158GTX3_CABSO|nr:amylo-alpha-1,6-glucosidase [Caballeronia sordidicola]SAL35535.1 Amylo-alpha-1,6-glucosidase [Caballeronia sordidicola]
MTRIDSPAREGRLNDEWLEAEGFGGFASGTASTERTRRYHALLLSATQPPTGRMVLVNGVEAWLEDASGNTRIPLTMQRYGEGSVWPDISASLLSFDTEPWPTWRFQIGDAQTLTAEVLVGKASARTVLRWRLDNGALTLKVRPLMSGRDYHALHHENAAFNFDYVQSGDQIRWQAYGDVPAVVAASNGSYVHAPDWYRNFCYTVERERGMDFNEDLATPGVFSFDLLRGDAVLVLSANEGAAASAEATATQIAETERARRATFSSTLERSADSYVVARNEGTTILAGFPWFTDWGRDTFIAMRGLLIASGRLGDAESILLEWSGTISEGMLPNRFPDSGGAPEYNSVDASLWFVIAVHDYLATGHAGEKTVERLRQAVDAILDGYTSGTRYQIAADPKDGLLRAGVPGVQLTWMDAKVADWVVTPRIGKPVEVQALWINALRVAAAWNPRRTEAATRATHAFQQRFTDPASGALYDVVDVDHESGEIDHSVRPNQLFAVGGLPFSLIDNPDSARAIVDQCEQLLLTPMGMRTLSPQDPAYKGRYTGTPLERDGAYHQGTVWPWLLGAFVEAWLRVHGNDAACKAQARERFLKPLHDHLHRAGLDHVSEVADADAPHTPGGTPFQAWSLGELMRIERLLVTDT